MSDTCCTAHTSTGRPCAARPLPGSGLCLFHDPAHQSALTESRSKGGSTPRRRTRRYPLLLDYKHVAELLSELFIDALNDPAACDPQRLRALTGLSSVLLKAVGRPRNIYESYDDHAEPAANEEHLLRIHAPEPPELADLLAADAEIEAEGQPAEAPKSPDPSNPSDPTQSQPHLEQPNSSTAVCLSPGSTDPGNGDPGAQPIASLLPIQQDDEQVSEQGRNRDGTGTPATSAFLPLNYPGQLLSDSAAPHGSGCTSARSADSDLWADLDPCSSPVVVAQPAPEGSLPGENACSQTVSVPGVPILIAIRQVPRPFG